MAIKHKQKNTHATWSKGADLAKNGSCVVVGLDLCYTVIYIAHQKSGDRVTETVQFYDVITYNYVCIKIKQNNNVNYFYIMLNCT